MITLRRVIFQSDFQAFKHGRIISNPFTHSVELAPNLDLIPRVNDAYLYLHETMTRPPATTSRMRTGIFCAMPFISFTETTAWPKPPNGIKILGEKYPDKTLLDNDSNSFPRNLTLDDYAVARIHSEFGDTSEERYRGNG